MATISLRFVINGGATTITGTRTVSDSNASRILVSHRTLYGTANNQETADIIIQRLLDEMIGNTKTIERNAAAVTDIPVTP